MTTDTRIALFLMEELMAALLARTFINPSAGCLVGCKALGGSDGRAIAGLA